MHNDPSNTHSLNWDDFRFVLAVADTGSVAAAARRLGVAHTTVLRRIAAFETETGARLFDRTARGYSLGPGKIKELEALRNVHTAVVAAHAQIAAVSVAPGQSLRLTSTDTLSSTIIPDILPYLNSLHPDLEVAILSFNTHLDLGHGHADVTLRPADTLPDDLSGKIAAQLGFAVYEGDGAVDNWVGVTGPLARSVAGGWMSKNAPEPTMLSDSFVVISRLLERGLGRSLIPCILGDRNPGLRRTSGPKPVASVPIWVAAHKELADSRRLIRLRGDLVKAVAPFRGELSGIRGAAG